MTKAGSGHVNLFSPLGLPGTAARIDSSSPTRAVAQNAMVKVTTSPRQAHGTRYRSLAVVVAGAQQL